MFSVMVRFRESRLSCYECTLYIIHDRVSNMNTVSLNYSCKGDAEDSDPHLINGILDYKCPTLSSICIGYWPAQ